MTQRRNSTRQRQAIQGVLSSSDRPLSVEEIWERASRYQESLGLRTVFRHMQEGVKEGSIVRVIFPGQPPRYERPAKGHHPHFVCFGCGGVFDLPGETPDVEKMCSVPPGFEATGGEVTLFGRCADCVIKSKVKTDQNEKSP